MRVLGLRSSSAKHSDCRRCVLPRPDAAVQEERVVGLARRLRRRRRPRRARSGCRDRRRSCRSVYLRVERRRRWPSRSRFARAGSPTGRPGGRCRPGRAWPRRRPRASRRVARRRARRAVRGGSPGGVATQLGIDDELDRARPRRRPSRTACSSTLAVVACRASRARRCSARRCARRVWSAMRRSAARRNQVSNCSRWISARSADLQRAPDVCLRARAARRGRPERVGTERFGSGSPWRDARASRSRCAVGLRCARTTAS